MELSIQRANLACSGNDQGLEEKDTLEGPIQRGVGTLNSDKIRLTTGGTADLLGSVTCDGVDCTAVHLKRRLNKEHLKRRKGIHEILSLFVEPICNDEFQCGIQDAQVPVDDTPNLYKSTKEMRTKAFVRLRKTGMFDTSAHTVIGFPLREEKG